MKHVMKTIATLMVLVLMVGIFAACGGSGSSSSSPASGASSEAASNAASAANPASTEAQYVIKYSATFPPSGTQADGAHKLQELVAEKTNGAAKVELYPSSQLGDKIASMEGLRAGTIEMTESAATDLSNYSPIWSVFSLPYLFDSGEQAIAVLTDPDVRAITEADAEAQGFIIISWCNLGERSILNSKRPVTDPESLKGLRIRVMQDPVLAGAINAMGAAGTPMAWSEVYTALQQKTIDGLENSPPVITANKMEEVAKYFSLTEQFIIPDPVYVSKKYFESLPQDVQDGIKEAGKAFEKSWNEEIWQDAMAVQIEALRSAGVEINEVDKDAFKAAVKPVVDEYLASADDNTKALYAAIETAKAKY